MGYKYFDQDYDSFLTHAEITKEDMKYGLPEKKAYPMPDRKHVLSAIKFFNYVSPKDEEKLAKAIIARMEEYGISEVNVGPDNRFGKYYEKTSLMHYQIKGAKHGVRRWQNPDGSWTPAGRARYGKGGAPRGSYKDNPLRRPGGKGRPTGDEEDNPIRLTGGRAALEKGPDAYNSKKEYLEAITKDCLYDPGNLKLHENDPEMKKRVIDAADLGLKAVENLRGPGYVDWEDEPNPGPHREWFYFEDQTIGMPMVADLINQGYTAKEVKKLIDELDSNYDYDTAMSGKSAMTNAMFQVSEGYELKEFADECAKVKAQEAKEKDNAASNEDNEISKPTRAEQKLEKTQAKLDAAKEKQASPKYQKNVEKKDKLERQLEALGLKTQKIRDNKLFRDKEPGFFDRMKLNKEARLQKKLSKINKKINKVDDSVNKLTKKQDKYQQKVDRQYKYDARTREAMREARENGYDSLTEEQRKLLREVANSNT